MSQVSFQVVNQDDYIDEQMNGLDFFGHCLATENLFDIFSFLDTQSLYQCRLVCKLWKDMVEDPLFWKHKTLLENKIWPNISLNCSLPWFFYENIYSKQPFNRNLIQNPYAKDTTEHWDVKSKGGDGFAFEEPPMGADNVPEEVKDVTGFYTNSCFATSYHSCSKEQIIDLLDLGLSSEIIEKLNLKFQFTDWFAGRFDCGCIYECQFSLLNDKYEVLDKFEERHTIQQWNDRKWHKVEYCFENRYEGLRSLKFYHGGCDTQYWAGHYGAKMTGSCIKIICPS